MSAPVRVLHLDDNPFDAQLVSMMLELDRKKLATILTYVQSEAEFRAALERGEFDVILSDYRMPDFDGDRALLLAKEKCPEVPFIMVTGELGEDRAIDTVKRGASDYVLKGNMIRLVPAIERALAEAENSRKRREAEQERERLLREVQQNRAELLATFQAMSGGVVVFDMAGNVVLLNDAEARLLGYPGTAALGRNLSFFTDALELTASDGRVVPPEDWPIAHIMRGESVVNRELRGRRRETGQEWFFSFSGEPVRDQSGKQMLSVLVMRDITERKRTEEALRQSESRVRRKLENMLSPETTPEMFDLADLLDVPALQKLMDDFYAVAHIPMSLVDVQGRVLVGVGWQDICTRFHRVHPESCRHCLESDLELSANLAQGEFRLYKCKNNMWDLATPIRVDGRHLGNVFSGQFFFEGETVDRELFRCQARRYGFDEEDYLSALDRVPRLSRENVELGTAFFLTLADTLSRLGQSNISLARLLTERERLARSLREEQEQLTQARENTQLLESFAYTVSHDLKAPLRVISGYAGALAGLGEKDLTPRQQEAVRTIQQGAGRMEELIDALLEFSRVSRQELERRPVDTRRMVEEVIRDQRRALGEEAGNRVVVELGALPPVVADPPLLRQVFANLLSNAFKFTRTTAAPHIRVEAQRSDEQVVFRVSDNGVGFPGEKAGVLFAVFQRLHPSREFEGTGLGLANVRKIVERHGGWVSAEGHEGAGSVFSFALPLAGGPARRD